MASLNDVVIIGAGVAGLAAAQRLRAAGLEPLVVEARQRPGGRVWTDRTRDPVELGAEFVHGRQAITWQLIQPAGLAALPWPPPEMAAPEKFRLARAGALCPDPSLAVRVEQLCAQVEQYAGPDRHVQEVLAELVEAGDEATLFALNRLACMEAADLTRLSALALAEERALNRAGWDNFRLPAGYDALPALLAEGLVISYGAAVVEVAWADRVVSLVLSTDEVLRATQVIVTVPLGLLQQNSPRFVPALPAWKQQGIAALAMGPVTKLILWFDRPAWPPFAFLGTDGMVLTWWPAGSPEQPALVGYAGGPAALRLAALGQEQAIARGLAELTDLFDPGVEAACLGGRLVDWAADPWSRGGYSYTPLGAGQARANLAAPLLPTLFFAGEATSTNGHVGTVHGAIESGWRAADELLGSRSNAGLKPHNQVG